MMLWGLSNLWKEGEEGGYAVQHGQQLVSDFGWPRTGDNSSNSEVIADGDWPNYFERAFPCLFAYGVGSLEADRQVEVDFRDHIKWALDYHDHHFGRHEMFPFVAFGIVQQRQVLYSARLQMCWETFDTDARLLSMIMLKRHAKKRRITYWYLIPQSTYFENTSMLLEVVLWHQTRHNISFAVRFGLHLSILICHHFGSPLIPVIYMTQSHRCSAVKKSIWTISWPLWAHQRNDMLKT